MKNIWRTMPLRLVLLPFEKNKKKAKMPFTKKEGHGII
jgi:hypothetical protein